MPKVPSPQIKKLKPGFRSLWEQFNAEVINRPKLNTRSAICFTCGAKYLNPKVYGEICPKCQKKQTEKVKVDAATKTYLKKHPVTRRRFQY